MMRVFMAILCSLLAVCSVSARNRRHEGTDGQAAIYPGIRKNITRM